MNFRTPHTARERGATSVEYALLVALIATIIIGGVAMLGRDVSSSMTAASDGFDAQVEEVTTTIVATTTTLPLNQLDVKAGKAGTVRFEEVDGKVRVGDISPADGWTVTVSGDDGVRPTVHFTNTKSGAEVVRSGYLNKKGKLVKGNK